MITLTPVDSNNPVHVAFLFSILESRGYSISHSELPTISDHVRFVKSHPYRTWDILIKGDKLVGAVYVGFDNSVALHFLNPSLSLYKEGLHLVLNKYRPLNGIPSLRASNFIFNTNPEDAIYQKALKDIGCQLLQNTYVLLH